MKFKKKLPEPANPAIVLSPSFEQENEQSVQQEQPIQQNQQQPIQQQQPVQQSVQQPVQQEQQFIPTALIIQGNITEGDTFQYIVETNYPLKLGGCQLEQ